MGKTDGQRWRRGARDAEEKAEGHAWRTAGDVAVVFVCSGGLPWSVDNCVFLERMEGPR